jgi:tetratricopeptide (TPR) repeat protein
MSEDDNDGSSSLVINNFNEVPSISSKVKNLSHGLSRQHFISIDRCQVEKGPIYKAQFNETWDTVLEIEDQERQSSLNETNFKDTSISTRLGSIEFNNNLFPTEIDENVVENARKRLEATSKASLSYRLLSGRRTQTPAIRHNYLIETGEELKEYILDLADQHYNTALKEFNNEDFETSLRTVTKALQMNSFSIQFHLLRIEIFIQMCDFKSAQLAINKLLSIISIWTDADDSKYDELKERMLKKTIFCHYSLGQVFFDCKLYIDSLDSFNKAVELEPSNLVFKIRR